MLLPSFGTAFTSSGADFLVAHARRLTCNISSPRYFETESQELVMAHQFSGVKSKLARVLVSVACVCWAGGAAMGDAADTAVVRSAASGPWSAPQTWVGGQVPAAG